MKVLYIDYNAPDMVKLYAEVTEEEAARLEEVCREMTDLNIINENKPKPWRNKNARKRNKRGNIKKG